LNFLGFLRQHVTAEGPTLADHVFADARGELPPRLAAKSAWNCPMSSTWVTNFWRRGGTGSITTSTAVGTLIGFSGGKVRVSQDDEESLYQLSQQLTPEEGETVRIRCNKR
jgi:hypothetical protein